MQVSTGARFCDAGDASSVRLVLGIVPLIHAVGLRVFTQARSAEMFWLRTLNSGSCGVVLLRLIKGLSWFLLFGLASLLSGCIVEPGIGLPGLCSGELVCEGKSWGDCVGLSSCDKKAVGSCDGLSTCKGNSDGSCGGISSCDGSAAGKCDGTISCEGIAESSCDGLATCEGQATCEGAGECEGQSTCDGTAVCAGDSGP